MLRLVLVALGGAVGTAARYGLALALAQRSPSVAIVAVNVLGSFMLGALAQASRALSLGETTYVVLGVGVLGGFTTYSSFNQDTLRLLHDGALGKAMAYAGVTLFGCLLASEGGAAFARAVFAGQK